MQCFPLVFALALSLTFACMGDDKATSSTKAVEAENLSGEASAPRATDPVPEPEPIEPAPVTGTHLDGADTGYRPRDYQPTRNAGKTIELILRSSPPGARASIDGKTIGITPSFWRGEADGRPHEFTFVKSGYAMARYRFVATQSGVVHGSLAPLVESPEADAGPAKLPPKSN